MNNPLQGMFEDDNGGASSTRFVFIGGTFLVLGIWAYLCIKANAFVSIPVKDLGILVLLTGGKLGGKWLEVIEAIKSPNEGQK